MRGKNILCASLAFLTILISAFFGASIYNSKSTELITHLDVMDNIHHFDPAIIPLLNFQAALYTLPLVLTVFVMEIIISLKAEIRQVKNIGRGLTFAAGIILTFAILTIMYPNQYDFSVWGYVWITMGIFITAGNVLSVFIKKRT